ncbi:multidrug resistance protein fnx1 [Magnaporthiopsis poae ATCC 64411]|uniref:Multidrug resistance protein fnx1 n=1 Tax=Magnaporthiopsis poae (strain ATCC 64411 / 73-15) TaxID=644358 RepID=A0A0C4E8X6_MAGP6|nr:multidrug resistance protein fnx1 [Magnaporthiopsis poae ATCC 64411]
MARPDDEEHGAGGAEPRPDEQTPLLSATIPAAEADSPAAETIDAAGEVTVLAEDVSTTRLAFIMGTAWVGVFLGAVDTSIFATLSAPISSEFHSLSLFSWLATAYLIANAACQPISGRLTDLFGRGPGLVFSNVFFAAGNLICGLAQDGGTMIAGRVIAGIGGGGLMSISTFLGSDLIPLRKRGVWQGIGNLAYGSGAMLGGVFGGFANDHTAGGWRFAFLAQVPVVLVSAVLAFWLIRVPPKLSNKSLISRIDFTGVLLTLSFLILLLLGLNAGGNLVPWSHPLPVIPVRLLLDRTIIAACCTNLLSCMALMMVVYFVPLYMQVLGHSASEAGVRLISSPLGTAVSSLTSGVIMKRTGRYVWLAIATLMIYVSGFVVAATLDQTSSSWTPMAALFLLGLGFGAMLTITLMACLAAADHSNQAVITSATYAFRSIGSTLGITVASAIYQNELRVRLWDRFGDLPGAAEEIARIRDDLGELKHLPEGWREGVILSFMEAFRGVWLMALGLAVLALVTVSLLKQHTLHITLSRK